MIDGGLGGLLRDHLPHIHWQRVESGTSRGIPDMNYCVDGAEGWIELKWTLGWTVDLRPEQVAWLMRRSRSGGRVHILVRQRCRKMRRDSMWLLDGGHADMAQEQGLPKHFCGHPHVIRAWHSGPRNWNWGELESYLRCSGALVGATCDQVSVQKIPVSTVSPIV